MIKRYKGIGVTWWIVLLSAVAVLSGGFLQVWLMTVYGADMFSSMAVSQIFLIVPLVLGMIYLKRNHPYASLSSLLGVRGFEPELMIVMLLMPAGVQYLATFIQFPYIEQLTELFGEQVDFGAPSTVSSFLWLFVAICVVAPILEELIFRGVLMKILEPYGSLAAIMISSLCFTLLHFAPAALITIFIVGIAIGFVRLYTDSVLACMLFHSSFNFSSLMMLVLEKELEKLEIAFGIYALLMSCLFPILFFILYRSCGRGKWYSGTIHKIRGGVLPCILTLVIYSVMAFASMLSAGSISFDYDFYAPEEEYIAPREYYEDDSFGFDMFEEFDSFFDDYFEGGDFSQ